ncbi:lipid droplet-associated hydrolase-like [Watersipora subatra]|uniref:lipid droplet-associated hydrolase-like n=1 Tax=Watersipora subatra TaxID=2589382 RepID=UPI00355AD075
MSIDNAADMHLSGKETHEYPNIHGIHTHVIKCGQIDSTKRLVVVIPGNPGAIGFYEKFMSTLHKESGWPVWGLSHAGHSVIPKHVGWKAPLSEVFTMKGQIEHKVRFIDEHVPKDVKMVLIGHSIGAQFVLEVMERLYSDRVIQGMLLFPTLEKMAESPRGKRLTPVFKYWRWLLVFMSAMLWLLPTSWKTRLINNVFEKRRRAFKSVPDCIKKTAHSMVHPYCVWNATYLANIEMQTVVDLKVHIVRRHLAKLRFYYGATDHWAPPEHYHRMVELFPSHDKIELCTDGFRHAFIIDASEPMASKVSGWLQIL